jgi:hypothetical protein
MARGRPWLGKGRRQGRGLVVEVTLRLRRVHGARYLVHLEVVQQIIHAQTLVEIELVAPRSRTFGVAKLPSL